MRKACYMSRLETLSFLQAEAAPRAMGHHLDWPRRLGMALDAAKVPQQLLHF